MVTSVKDRHPLDLDGTHYLFRSPTIYDPPKARRVLTRQRVRRPALNEFRVAAIAGVEQMAELANMPDEGARQRELVDEWYSIINPVREDDLDEPDPIKRGELYLQQETERSARVAAIYPEIAAINANLERHYQPYAELVADKEYWDDVSRIEIVRLLLVEVDGVEQPLDDDDMLLPAAYQAIPAPHRMPLATFAFGLMAPSEAQRKN